jgi:hypothetical protein
VNAASFWDSSRSTEIVLLAAIGISAVPVWMPLIRRKSEAHTFYRYALISTALGQFVVTYFIAAGVLLSDSHRYALVGGPLFLIGAGLAWTSVASERRGVGCAFSAMFGCLLWLFLVSVH